MSNKDLLDKIKKLREITSVGFKDCKIAIDECDGCLLYTSPSPRDGLLSRMPSSA